MKPQVTFNDDLEEVPFADLMKLNTKNIKKGINLGKENGLSLLLDAEVYDYAFSPQKGKKKWYRMIRLTKNLILYEHFPWSSYHTYQCISILGEGYKIAIHNHMDQPIMSLSDIDLSPGFVTQLSVTPTLHETTDQGKKLGKNISL